MSWLRVNFPRASTAVLRLVVLGLVSLLTGCVAPIPIKDQAPKASYPATGRVALAIIDSRPSLREDKKPPTYIGRAHGVFGIPQDMQVYPWVALKEEKSLTLAQELEQRMADALQAMGATAVRLDAGAHQDADSAVRAAQAVAADRLLLITLDEWSVNVNLNWVGSFDFDWGYTVEVCDRAGTQLAKFKDSGQDVVKEQASDSPRNMITAAFRTRLEKLLERPEVRSGLSR
ncbi:MAG TPA: hypothetical protein VNZ53_15520 [Steroidobacteraceae bacterium]|jgi:hypothetical protein|nr:hypothetical protein [Steroidobacteraceae bacterium]